MEGSENKTAGGKLFKMEVTHENPIQYKLKFDELISINDWIGKDIQLHWNGEIECLSLSNR